MLEVTTNERGISKNLKKDTIKVLLIFATPHTSYLNMEIKHM
jgi:hypothetical protein